MKKTHVIVAVLLAPVCWLTAHAQESRWATPEDPTAKPLITWERLWAEAACTHNGIQKTILAGDFHGTAPDGSLYSKKEALAEVQRTETGCTMFEVKVHFFGDAMAILYGSERAIHTENGGRKQTVKLTWTDTWLKRNGTWQVVAAQDMPSDVK
jgi:hypothetical protein